jgi:3-isopropylmalate/(R)-2-methylmalate dehydratase small subunit
MTLKFRGKAWVFGDNLDVDKDIVPFRKWDSGIIKMKELGNWCLTPMDPDFPKKVKKGDILVAGSNMGCGHDHREANLSIKQSGISCVIAELFDRNFFRNSIHVGLPVIEYRGIKQKVKAGDELEVDLRAGEIKNLTTGAILRLTPFPDFLLEILEADGIDAYTDKLIAEGKI